MNPRTFVRFSLLGLLLSPSAITAAPTLDAALVLTLDPGTNTAGIGLVEVYNLR